jgi:hypothetical protein
MKKRIKAAMMSSKKQRVWLVVGIALAVVILANVHLVYVAVTTQPDCVPHQKHKAEHGQSFRSAKSAC